MLRSIFIFFSFSFVACQSAREDKDLDIALKATKASEIDPLALSQDSKMLNRQVDRVDWLRFFKPPPDAKQRLLIQQKLNAWKDDQSPEALLSKARSEVAMGQIAVAETTYRELLRQNSDHGDALLELAQIYLGQMKIDHCFDLLGQVHENISAAEATPKDFIFRYKYTLALAHIGRDERQKGHKILGELISTDRTFGPGYAALASSYIAMNKMTLAEFIAKRGLDSAAEDPALMNIMGIIQESKGQTLEARRWFDKAIELIDNYPPALVNRAKLSVDLREYEAAEGDLSKALAAAPAHVEGLILLGIVQRRLGRHDAARQSFVKAIEINPESAHARYNLGMLMFDHYKEPTTALRLFHEVLQTRDKNDKIKELAKVQVASMTERWINGQ